MSTNSKALEKIFKLLADRPHDNELYEDALNIILGDAHLPQPGYIYTQRLRQFTSKALRDCTQSIADRLYLIARRSLQYDATKLRFDSYLRYIELNRPQEKRFYAPRRGYLKQVVDAYQEVVDGKTEILAISMVKRAGKSQLGVNFINMLSGHSPDKSTLIEGAGDALVNSFYRGLLQILQTGDYLHYDVFPAPIVETNAEIKTINLLMPHRFPTIMCRSLEAKQIGLSEATNLLYLDDCVDGHEEALNRDRLDKKWETIAGDVLGRRVEGTPIVICGTRYSIYDPMARLIHFAEETGMKYKEIKIPALDPETDKSNYEFTREGRKIFTTKFFKQQQTVLTEGQWFSEFQQEPFETKGMLFPTAELKRFFEPMTHKEPDTVIAVIDTAERGGDSVSMPIAAIYGEMVYIVDWVHDSAAPEFTKPLCAKKLIQHNVVTCIIESNNAGEYYGRDVEALVRSNGGRVSIRYRRSISNKQTRIEMASDGILRNFYFLDATKYTSGDQYWRAMRELTTYTRVGRVKHDDAPDALALLENEIRKHIGNKVVIFKRPF